MKLLDKKIVVISGGTGYAGSFLVKKLAEEGMKIIMVHRNSSLMVAKKIIETLPGEGHATYCCHLDDEISVNQTVRDIEESEGIIYACIHMAGGKPLRKKIIQTTQEEMLLQFTSTALGGFNLLTSCGKKMKERGDGVLIGVTTAGVVVEAAAQSLGAYTPAKYALQGVLVMLKHELAPSGVRVYSVAPGFMEGGMNSGIPQAFVEIIRQKSVSKVLLTRENLATSIVELCQPSQITKETELTLLLAPEYE